MIYESNLALAPAHISLMKAVNSGLISRACHPGRQ
jgi:hypothetical protein